MIENILNGDWNYKNKEVKIKKSLDFNGVYPRWMAFANVTRNDGKSINSIFYVGNSKKEIELGVAKGFPKVVLNENETIISETYMKFFGFDRKHVVPGKGLHDENMKLILVTAAVFHLLMSALKDLAPDT